MDNINNIVRPCILGLSPYSTARDEYKGSNGVFLDANENPFGTFNRYPDPYQNKLKNKLSEIKEIPSNNIFVGNGSDEVIDLAFRVFCEPGKDKAIIFSPSYGMYNVSASINDVELVDIPLNEKFQIDFDKTREIIKNENIKLIFICSPNNPTGNVMNKKAIRSLLLDFNGIIVVDEAYIDFTDDTSYIGLINQYPNLIVCQTLSKAWGLASVRIGLAYANQQIIDLFNKIKPPYNISQPNQEIAIASLDKSIEFDNYINIILEERERLTASLKSIRLVKKVYPSDANFILFEVENADVVYQQLINQNIIVRNRNKIIPNCIRVSIGTIEENNQLLKALNNIEL
jgi:histidinol-phosphate aminotransferase